LTVCTAAEQRKAIMGELRDEDRRHWWQKLADGIGEALAGVLQFLIEGWRAWNWRSRWFWGDKDDW
jgi:hypothetical protein